MDGVSNRCEVYLDGGVRRGTDVLKAVALGARAVFIGRPVLWGLTYDVSFGVNLHHFILLCVILHCRMQCMLHCLIFHTLCHCCSTLCCDSKYKFFWSISNLLYFFVYIHIHILYM